MKKLFSYVPNDIQYNSHCISIARRRYSHPHFLPPITNYFSITFSFSAGPFDSVLQTIIPAFNNVDLNTTQLPKRTL
jgi:hypothetical protein